MAMKAMKAAKAVAPPKAKRAKAMKAAKAAKTPTAMKAKSANAMEAAPKAMAVKLPTVVMTKGTKAKQAWTHFGTTNIRECWVETEYVTKKQPIVRVWGKLV